MNAHNFIRHIIRILQTINRELELREKAKAMTKHENFEQSATRKGARSSTLQEDEFRLFYPLKSWESKSSACSEPVDEKSTRSEPSSHLSAASSGGQR